MNQGGLSMNQQGWPFSGLILTLGPHAESLAFGLTVPNLPVRIHLEPDTLMLMTEDLPGSSQWVFCPRPHLMSRHRRLLADLLMAEAGAGRLNSWLYDGGLLLVPCPDCAMHEQMPRVLPHKAALIIGAEGQVLKHR